MDESIIPKKIFNLGKVCIESWISLPLLFILWGNPRIIPDDPPIVNINKKRKTKNGELVLRLQTDGVPT